MSADNVVPMLRVHRGQAEDARRDAIVAAAVELVRVYERRAKQYQHIALKELRPLRDAVRGDQQ